jgi:glycosyltransferase involved in cell wall biosynthesis
MHTLSAPHTVVLDTATSTRPELSVLIPSYKGATLLRETLDSIVNQTVNFSWEIVICNDGSGDLTPDFFHGISIPLFVIEFHDNIGYPGNLQRCFDHGRGDYLMLLGQDDIVAPGYLQRVVDEFRRSPEIGAVTRSYYWFMISPTDPVRAKKIPSSPSNQSTDVTCRSPYSDWRLLVDSLDQLSGLTFRKSDIRRGVGDEIFTAHIWPFMDIASRRGARYLHCYPIAVRIDSSQSRHVSSIYAVSPASSWIRLIKHYSGLSPSIANLRRFIGENHIGLLQIRNYSDRPHRYVLREAALLIRIEPRNIVKVRFWIILLLCLTLPQSILRIVVDLLKPFSLLRRERADIQLGAR